MVCWVTEPNANTKIRALVVEGKKWGQPTSANGPRAEGADSSGETSTVGAPPRAGTS
mgnify:CR=1 FL=1